MKHPEYKIDTFSYAAELLTEHNIWDIQLSKSESKDLQAVIARTAALLADLGLDPDRKYTVADITAIRDGIAYVLGGN